MDPTEDALIEQINNFIDAHGYKQDNQLLFYFKATATSKSAMSAYLAICCL